MMKAVRSRSLFLLVAGLWVTGCTSSSLTSVAGHRQAPDRLLPSVTGPCTGQEPGCGSRYGLVGALAAGRWSRFASGPLSVRTGEVEVWMGNELIVWGGETAPANSTTAPAPTPVPLGDGAAYDPSTGLWRRLPRPPLSPRENAAAVWTGSQMVVIGGDDGASRTFADAAAFDPATDSWSKLPPLPTGPASGATAVWTGRQIIVVGGTILGAGGACPGCAPPPRLDAVAFDPSTGAWARLPSTPSPSGWRPISVTPTWTGHELVLFVTSVSGTPSSGLRERDTGYSLSAGASSWRDLPKPPVETNDAKAVWTGSRVLVAGGSYCPGRCPGPFYLRNAAEFDPDSGRWMLVPRFAVAGAQWPATWTGVTFLDGPAYNAPPAAGVMSFSAYDPATQRWTTLPRPPEAIINPTGNGPDGAVWTGRQLLVWGEVSGEFTARLPARSKAATGGAIQYLGATGLSCPTARECIELGNTQTYVTADAWYQGRFVRLRNPLPADLVALSCPVPTMCMAVGSLPGNSTSFTGCGGRIVAEVWYGSTWRWADPPTQASECEGIEAVTCLSARWCMAVGGQNEIGKAPSLTLAEIWDGRTWRVVHTADPAGAVVGSNLAGIACASKTACLAVGSQSTG